MRARSIASLLMTAVLAASPAAGAQALQLQSMEISHEAVRNLKEKWVQFKDTDKSDSRMGDLMLAMFETEFNLHLLASGKDKDPVAVKALIKEVTGSEINLEALRIERAAASQMTSARETIMEFIISAARTRSFVEMTGKRDPETVNRFRNQLEKMVALYTAIDFTDDAVLDKIFNSPETKKIFKDLLAFYGFEADLKKFQEKRAPKPAPFELKL